QAEQCIVTLHAENLSDTSGRGLFAPSINTANELRAMAKRLGIQIAPVITLSERHRFVSPALAAVEGSIFRYDGSRVVYDEPAPEVTVYEAEGRYDELEYCARECRRLLREEGYRCRDIAIITRTEAAYADIAADALELQGIPCFMDKRLEASSCALMQFVLSALDVIKGGRQCEDLLRLMKTGLISGISDVDIAEIENYCYVWNIRGGRWRERFEQNPDGFAAEMTEVQAQRLGRINEVRSCVMSLIDNLTTGMHQGSGMDMAAALYRLIEDAGVAERLRELCADLPIAQQEEQARLWDALMAILSQLAAIIGERRIAREDFCLLVSLMINRCDTGHIPQGLDEVTFGSADRIRTTAPRAVFVIGALEGEFPAVPSNSGVFTDDERKRLRDELSLPVAEPMEKNLLEERLLAYNALSAASERLYITYPVGAVQEAFRSEFVGEVLACVPQARVLRSGGELTLTDVESAAAAFELAARHRADNTALSASLTECVGRREEGRRMRALIAAAQEDIPTLGRAEAAQMFGGRLRISPSKAETFHKCRFQFFCRYGLNLSPRRRAKLDYLQFGTAAHYVLEHIFGSLKSDAFSALSQDAAGVRRRVSELLERYLTDELGGADDKAGSFLYQLRRMADSLTALVLNFAAELSCSDFRPVAFELSVAPDGDVAPCEIVTPSGTRMIINGKVDRVDCYDEGGKRWLRVIDYKTGKKEFRLSDVLEGLNMQMLIYLGELCREDGFAGSPIPAGILYCPAFSSTLSQPRDVSDASLRAERGKSLIRSGIIIDDSEDNAILSAMENGLGGKYIPVTLKKDGTLSQRSEKYIITPTAYEIVRKYVRHRLSEMCGTLEAGEISQNPVQDKYSPCERCDYIALCRYEGKLREKRAVDDGEAVMLMASEMNERGGDAQ
ncbi:MAG: PD-(D/E)XK nuclease family protein, partial [Clostridia bacterium]|nr:PD-(D/E)XK nuclease family protein [Clostridia bacterium]